MKTYQRTCIKDFKITGSNGVFKIKKGKEYATSRSTKGKVVVFTNYWVAVDKNLFSPPRGIGEKQQHEGRQNN